MPSASLAQGAPGQDEEVPENLRSGARGGDDLPALDDSGEPARPLAQPAEPPTPAPAPAAPSKAAPAAEAKAGASAKAAAGTAAGTVAGAPGQQPLFTETMLQLLRGFRFGSYGRIGASGDLSLGSKAKSLNVVNHGPRLEEPPYAELDLGYVMDRGDKLSFRVAFTLAFMEDFFHYNGVWEASMAVRNLYLEATNVFTPHLSLWAGSRMYRGDDIYLLDFWPLDNLNTVGGGLRLAFGGTSVNLHGGVNRLADGYQYQKYPVASGSFGTDDVEVLDRQRAIFSLKATHELHDLSDWLSMKLILYGEVHHLPAGSYYDQLQQEDLPSDEGFVAGFQVGLWGFGDNSHVNLFGRVAGGLAAYGELAVPSSNLDLEKRAAGAREYLLALSANFERGIFGLMAGGYLRYFEDADGEQDDVDDGWEGVLSLRPIFFIHDYFQQAVELSWQQRRPNGLNPRTATHLVPDVVKLSLLPTLSWGPGSYTRPQIRFVYTLTYMDEDARLQLPTQDPRAGESVHHFMGVQVEWWFNSSYR